MHGRLAELRAEGANAPGRLNSNETEGGVARLPFERFGMMRVCLLRNFP
jgi:hypothetical protein